MVANQSFDLIIHDVRVVRPQRVVGDAGISEPIHIGVKDGKIAGVSPDLPIANGAQTFDGNGLLAFPGAIDAHMHIGIYRELSQDARTESQAAAQGGVTTALTYIRTGSYYLHQGGSWHDFVPELRSRSQGNYYVDYAYHLSPIESGQLAEMDFVANVMGAPNFGELFMFYGSHGLHGSSDNQRKWLMLPEGDEYNLAHFERICQQAGKLAKKYPDLAPFLQVSFHCETPEMLRAYEKQVKSDGELSGLRAWHAARPPASESVAISIAGALANAAGLTQVNILHITSQEAMEAALRLRQSYPHIEFGFEVTAGHLLLDVDANCGALGKVNPPLRTAADRDFLWQNIADGSLEWVITDHAACPLDMKLSSKGADDIWEARAGFGGTEYLLAGIYSEAIKRGFSPNKVAELTSWKAAQRFGLGSKGDLVPGYDADIALLDPNEKWTIRAEDSFSAQEYSPFEGLELTGRVKSTFLRGNLIYNDGNIVGDPSGNFVRRPS